MAQAQNVMPVYGNEQGYLETWGIGGDRFAMFPQSMFHPQALVGTTDPSTLAVLSIPPTYDQLGHGYGQAYGPSAQATAHNDPWNPKASLVPWVILALVIGWFGIHRLYYKKGRRK